MLAILFLGLGAWWPAVFIGALLSFLFLHQLAMCLATLRETSKRTPFRCFDGFVVLGVVGLVLVSIAYGLSLQSRQGARCLERGLWHLDDAGVAAALHPVCGGRDGAQLRFRHRRLDCGLSPRQRRGLHAAGPTGCGSRTRRRS
jgi:hypothetical protein